MIVAIREIEPNFHHSTRNMFISDACSIFGPSSTVQDAINNYVVETRVILEL
jgi:hypothetical protein